MQKMQTACSLQQDLGFKHADVLSGIGKSSRAASHACVFHHDTYRAGYASYTVLMKNDDLEHWQQPDTQTQCQPAVTCAGAEAVGVTHPD